MQFRPHSFFGHWHFFTASFVLYGITSVHLETLATQAKQQEQLEQLEQLQQQLQQQQESMDRGLIATTTLSTKEFPKPPFRLEETSLHSQCSFLVLIFSALPWSRPKRMEGEERK
jgi:hypothetical protein